MKIDNVSVLTASYPDSRGYKLHYLFVRVELADGVVGYGEISDGWGCLFPAIEGAVVESAIAPLVQGQELDSVPRIMSLVTGRLSRRPGLVGATAHALSGVDIALWDALGKSRGVPVSELIGGWRTEIPVYASGAFLSEMSAKDHAQYLGECLERGVKAVKVRTALEWRSDMAVLKELRSLLGEDIRIFVDGTENYSLAAALQMCRAFAEAGVEMFEEPIPQGSRSARQELVSQSPIAIGYGEHLSMASEFEDTAVNRMASILQPDPAITGGILEMLKVGDIAEYHGLPVMPHSAAGPVSLAACLHACSAMRNVPMFEYPAARNEFSELVTNSLELSPSALRNGCLQVPEGPGLGIEVDEAQLARLPYDPDDMSGGPSEWSIGAVF
ncbi:mandelate racemase/muconate lactonizing enzyme family protein [Aeromicrobium sp. P5_D10]